VVAVGNVKGFALTLGITTIIDVLIVIMFTHPILRLIAQTRFFSSGHPLSGLDPTALGAIYRGRAEFRISPEARKAGANREAARRQTIAERKAAEFATANSRPAVDASVETTATDSATTARTTTAAAARAQPTRGSKSNRTGGKKS
jgi:preprotein translocase subunit SecD